MRLISPRSTTGSRGGDTSVGSSERLVQCCWKEWEVVGSREQHVHVQLAAHTGEIKYLKPQAPSSLYQARVEMALILAREFQYLFWAASAARVSLAPRSLVVAYAASVPDIA
eukprot:1662823-Rhodomonas_salina.1